MGGDSKRGESLGAIGGIEARATLGGFQRSPQSNADRGARVLRATEVSGGKNAGQFSEENLNTFLN
jgi:hypothetical protein